MNQIKLHFQAGIRGVDWDAVEQPSQFMENWCYDRKVCVMSGGAFRVWNRRKGPFMSGTDGMGFLCRKPTEGVLCVGN